MGREEGGVFSSDGGGIRACYCRSDGFGKFREQILEDVEAIGVGFCFFVLFFFYRVETSVEIVDLFVCLSEFASKGGEG